MKFLIMLIVFAFTVGSAHVLAEESITKPEAPADEKKATTTETTTTTPQDHNQAQH